MLEVLTAVLKLLTDDLKIKYVFKFQNNIHNKIVTCHTLVWILSSLPELHDHSPPQPLLACSRISLGQSPANS